MAFYFPRVVLVTTVHPEFFHVTINSDTEMLGI